MATHRLRFKIFWYGLTFGLFFALSGFMFHLASSAQSGASVNLGVAIKEVVRSWENDDHTKLFVETNAKNLEVQMINDLTGEITIIPVPSKAEISLSENISYQIVSGL